MKVTRRTVRDGLITTVGIGLVISGAGLIELPEHTLHGMQMIGSGLLIIVVDWLTRCEG